MSVNVAFFVQETEVAVSLCAFESTRQHVINMCLRVDYIRLHYLRY